MHSHLAIKDSAAASDGPLAGGSLRFGFAGPKTSSRECDCGSTVASDAGELRRRLAAHMRVQAKALDGLDERGDRSCGAGFGSSARGAVLNDGGVSRLTPADLGDQFCR